MGKDKVVAEDIIVGFGDIAKSGYLDRLYVHKEDTKLLVNSK